MTTAQPPLPMTVVRTVLGMTRQPLPEFLHQVLRTLMRFFDARCVFLARLEEDVLEVVDVAAALEPAPARGLRLPVEDTFHAAAATEVVNLRDASKGPTARLGLQRRLQVTGYLGVSIPSLDPHVPWGIIGIVSREARAFLPAEVELGEVIASIVASRLDAPPARPPRKARTPLSAIRLASDEVKEPLAILRGYADMLQRNEVSATEMPLVAERLAAQSETVVRVVDQVLLLARFPVELTFTVRVALGAVVRSVADRLRARIGAKGLELRLQLDADGEVWGDPALLEAAVDEMVSNVLRHAPSASVVQLRVRRSAPDRFQIVVKDDGPGISADRLAQLFADTDMGDEPPERGHGVGLYLLRRVAEAHGGGAWANSIEGKGTTFYLELPAASPDGEAVRASTAAPAPA